jgi:uncharacterized membrane protein
VIPVPIADELTVNRPRRDVFNFLADKERMPAWMAGVKRVRRQSPGPIGLGTSWAVVGKMLGRSLESTYELTSWTPPTEFSGRLVSTMFTFEETYRFEDHDGATKVHLEACARPGSKLKLLWPILALAVPRQVKADHRRMKTMLERKGSKVATPPAPPPAEEDLREE